jgi:hypothetical protein
MSASVFVRRRIELGEWARIRKSKKNVARNAAALVLIQRCHAAERLAGTTIEPVHVATANAISTISRLWKSHLPNSCAPPKNVVGQKASENRARVRAG